MVRASLLALTASLVGASAAQANPRPLAGLERAYIHNATQRIYGIGDNMSVYTKHATKVLPVYGIGDNMSFYAENASKAKASKSATKAVRPDDRAGIRGAGLVKFPALNDSSDVMSRTLNRWLATHVVRGTGSNVPEASLGHWERRTLD